MQDIPCTYRISVKALIKDGKGRVLLIRETDGKWELPGGGLDHGENPREGLKREISEETGFLVDEIADQPQTFWTIHKEVGSPTLKWFAFVAYEVEVSGTFRPLKSWEKEYNYERPHMSLGGKTPGQYLEEMLKNHTSAQALKTPLKSVQEVG